MTDHLTESLIAAERRLQAAMLAGDVGELDRLLHDRLLATLMMSGPQFMTKAEDLEEHRSRRLVLTSLVENALDVTVVESTGVTRALLSLKGVNRGEDFAVQMLYTRTWNREAGDWRVLAAHISPVT